MKKKKIFTFVISIVLVAVLLVCAWAVMAYLFNNGRSGNIEWKYKNGVLTIEGEGEMPNLGLVNPWDKYSEKTKEIVIGDGITSIEDSAFSWFTELEKVMLPDSVKTIGDSSFKSCISLKEVKWGNGVVSLDVNAFWGCISLENLNLPDSVEILENGAFAYCENLKTVHIGSKLKNMGSWVFSDCHEDIAISIDEENPFLVCENNVFFSKDKTTLIYYVNKKKDETYFVPEGVVKIGTYAFMHCDALKNVVLPKSLSIIDELAFFNVPMESIDVPDSVTEIGKGAFYSCRKLERVKLGKNVSKIDSTTFYTCYGLCEISVSEENEFYASENGILFNKAKTKLLAYPAGEKATVYEIPEFVTEIGDYAFSANSLLGIIVSDGVTAVGEGAFFNSSIEQISIPKSVTYLGERIFKMCESLSKINYEGTMAEWKKLAPDKYYDSWTADHTVICSDGEIAVKVNEK